MTDQEALLKSGTVVKCPSCGGFALRGKFDGSVELNCVGSRCGAPLLVVMSGDKITVEVIKLKVSGR